VEAWVDTVEVGAWADTAVGGAWADTAVEEAWVDTAEVEARADTAVEEAWADTVVEADPRSVMGELVAGMAVQPVAAVLLLRTRQREIEIRMWYLLPGQWYFRQQ
jgi:hypothetical protein